MINLAIHCQTKQNLHRNDLSPRKHSCSPIKQKPIDTLRFGATSIGSKQGNGITRLFDKPGKNFVWSAAYGILGALALPIPPLAIGLFSIGGIHLIISLIQAIAHKPKSEGDTQPQATDAAPNNQQDYKVEGKHESADKLPITPLSSEQQREQLVFDCLPGHFKDRLRLYKDNSTHTSRVREFTEEYGKLIQAVPQTATTYADYTEENKSNVKNLTYRLLNDPERLFVDIGRLFAYRLGMKPSEVERVVHEQTDTACLERGSFDRTVRDREKQAVKQHKEDVKTEGLQRIIGMFNIQANVTLAEKTNPFKLSVARCEFDDSVEYLLRQDNRDLAKMSLIKGSRHNPGYTMSNVDFTAIPDDLREQAQLLMTRLAIEESYLQDYPIVRCSSSVIPSQVLRQLGFSRKTDTQSFVLAGEPYFEHLSRLLPAATVIGDRVFRSAQFYQ